MGKADEIKRGEELLRTPKQLLTSIQQQEKFLFGQDCRTPPCPGCGEPLSKVEAAPETYRIGFSEGDDYDCPRCKTALRYILPFFGGGWFWQFRDPPFAKTGEQPDPAVRELIAGAAEAIEMIPEDELEEHARKGGR